MAGEFMIRVKEFADAIAYEIYTAAPFNQSQQPTKNLHFSPLTPTQGTSYREKMENEIKMGKEEKLQIHNQSLFSPTRPLQCFRQCFILDGSQM